MNIEPLPVTFRTEVVTPMMQQLMAGDSCSVVGIGSVGKSNLLRFLLREDVRQTQLGEMWDDYLFVYIDINKILKRSLWGLLELMLHQLMLELGNRDARESVLKTMEELHQRAAAPETQRLTLRYLDRAISIVCNQLKLRLVFLIDEFDDLCRKLPARGFAALRALRDEYKYQLMYLVATRLELKRLREDLLTIEPFAELVSPNTYWLGPYSEEDARLMLRRLESRHQLSLAEEQIKNMLQVTGGHPGLLREAYQVAGQSPPDLTAALTSEPQVQDECQRIWLSLEPEEQQVMVRLANNATVQSDQTRLLARLQRKGMVGGPWADHDHIFSPLLAKYVKSQESTAGTQVHVDRKRHTVWIKGREIRGLSPLEYKLIDYLEEKRNQVCSRDELAQHLYPDDMLPGGAGVTDTRLDSVVKRLRKQVEPNPKAPKFITTVRGHGFRLTDGHRGQP